MSLAAGCSDDTSLSADSGLAPDASAADASAVDSGPTPDATTDDAGAADAGPASDAGSHDSSAPSDASLADSATMFPDSGLADPEWTDLDVVASGECPEFSACGGEIVGVWDTSGGCFEVDIESAISRCPGATVTERRGRGRGRVVFGADGIAHRVAESQVFASVAIPAICTAVVSCDSIEALIASSASSATCTVEGDGSCTCDATYDYAIDNTSPYGTEGFEITAPGKRWEYCVEGDTLDYRDTSPSGMREPGVVELTRR